MRIIAWNCQGAFRKKAALILKYKPDIVVVPECEHPQKFNFTEKAASPKDAIWFGENLHKGLGVFSYSGKYKLRLLDRHISDFKTILPIQVENRHFNFLLFAVWANNPKDPDGTYVTQVWKAIHHYDDLLKNNACILAGDFNSNTIWDRPMREGNHSTVVEKLLGNEIHSLYHRHFKQKQGKEKHPTFYLYRDRSKPYHLDYCFASAVFLKKFKSIEIGKYKDWISYSDHVPVIMEIGS